MQKSDLLRIGLIAYLFVKHRNPSSSLGSQKLVAEMLGISAATVSRLLKMAKKRGLLSDTVCFDEHGRLTCAERQHIEDEASRRDLGEQLKNKICEQSGDAKRLRRIRIFASGAGNNWAARTRTFGENVAETVRTLILEPKVQVVGLTWGDSVRSVVDHIGMNSSSSPRRNPVEFVPLCGEPLQYLERPLTPVSSSALAHDLTVAINGPQYALEDRVYSLVGVPACVPMRFQGDKAEAIFELAAMMGSYRTIFETTKDKKGRRRPPLVDQTDLILTGVGASTREVRGDLITQRINLKELSDADLTRLVGDVGGFLVARKHRDNRKYVEEFNKRLTTLKEDHLSRCAQRAAEQELPGVVVLAISGAKAEVLLECALMGWVNEAFIDPDLARALAEMLGMAPGRGTSG